ncbi:Peptide deformylase [Thermodesulfobium narugense DSM 14796]|uniref:Peptide deformylase n=1 Tax=Thermodesulfobium narugense DSM 14796 TaxID=747365 RepID=M1E8R5_9BACT|nr:peptide deformylase [Thermodesulfobium narugense]AEE14634.1 Peptide deformylase [Thermodesulfobium narugense DSM 14796]
MICKRKIITHPNSLLRKRSLPVLQFDKNLESLVEEMEYLMISNNGVGLAAPQVGELSRLFIYKIDDNLQVVINPEIIEKVGSEVDVEGCLSVPGVFGPVERAFKVIVQAQNIYGDTIILNKEGYEARVIQHEFDHLNGDLFIDKAEYLETAEERAKKQKEKLEKD